MSDRTRTLAVAAGLAALAAFLFGVHVPLLHHARAAAPPPLGIELGDNSLDVSNRLLAAARLVAARAAANAAAGEGSFAAATFQADALSDIDWTVDHRFLPDPWVPADNTTLRQTDLDDQVATIERQANNLFSRSHRIGAEGTDIVGGTFAAQDRFQLDPQASPKELYLVSNMLAVSREDGLVMTRKPITKAFVEGTLRRLREEGKIPDLAGVCVYVIIGPGVGRKEQLSTSEDLWLRRFWTSFFDQAGSRVMSWTPNVTTFPPCGAD